MTSADDIRRFIVDFARDTPGRSTPLRVSDDFDLRRDGGIDSLRFVQLLAALEAQTGRTVDLADVDPERVTNLGVLSRHIAAQLAELGE